MKAKIKELRLIARTLTARKLFNLSLVYLSYFASRALHRPIHWGMPVSLGVEPTTACNLRCPMCVSGLRAFTRPTGRLKLDLYKPLIDELSPDLLYLILYFQGEPYLNPQFLELVKYAAQKGIFTMTSTNAHFLDDATARKTVESRLGRLVVSMDGVSQESYEQYRIGGHFETVVAGIKNLVRLKRELKSPYPFIDLQFIVFKHNEHEIAAIKALGAELGVDRVSIKTAQVYDFESDNKLIPDNELFSRYTRDEKGFRIKNKLLNHCWKLWQGAEMTWDGRVLPCCFDKDANHEMGRFPEKNFKQIWRNDNYRAFRSQILLGRKEIDMCRNCIEGTKVVLNDF